MRDVFMMASRVRWNEAFTDLNSDQRALLRGLSDVMMETSFADRMKRIGERFKGAPSTPSCD